MKGIRVIVGGWAIAALMAWLVGCRAPDALPKSDLSWIQSTRSAAPRTASLAEVPQPLRPEQKADIQLALAISAERQGRTGEAKKAYEEIIQLVPQQADAHHRLAVLLSRQGECEVAEEHYRRAVQLEPANARLHGDRGYNYYLQEKWAEAESSLRRAIELDDDLAHARNNLGMLLARTGREQEAMHQFAKAGCDRAQATANLALALTLEGQIGPAQEAYQRALRHDPNLAGARQMLANLESLAVARPAYYETPVANDATNAVVPASHHQHSGNPANR